MCISSSILNNFSKSIDISNLAGSSLAALAANEVKIDETTHLFVLPGKEEALFFFNDLEILLKDKEKPLNEKRVYYFPASFNKVVNWHDIDTTYLKMRAEVIDKLMHNQKGMLIVTYPDALCEKIVSKQYVQDNSFTVSKNELLPVDIFLEFLYEYQYKQEDFVFEPGQFAWRGSIFDVFSFSEENPYRIELNDETVETIRSFDPGTQLSLHELDALYIMPALSGVETETTVPFFDFLPKETTLWLKNIPEIQGRIDTTCERMEFEKNLRLTDFINDFKTVEIDSHFLQSEFSHNFNIKPQHHFNKNFELLLEEWVNNLERGFQTLFLSENPNQHERMLTIMKDLLEKYNLIEKTNYTVEQLFESKNYVLHEGYRDEENKICVYTDHQFFEKYHRFIIRDKYKRSEAFTLKELYDLQVGDYVVHVDHGIGVYQGLAKMEMHGREQEVIKLVYKDDDTLYMSIHSLHKITKYTGKDGAPPTIHRLGSGVWEKTKERTKTRVKELVINLVKLYAARKTNDGFSFSPDSYLQTELEASFIYEDTPDQLKTTNEVKKDMESAKPMDRLICGDVGFGKTEIAIRAAFKAVCDSKQVAMLVPTTVLALQHFNTFSERLKKMPCNVEYLNRFKSAKEVKEIKENLKKGTIDILIGTHRILSKDIVFKDLGLMIIDEEQKFGVAAKEKLREVRNTVDTLAMSATPIPRTLQFSLMGVRDISVIATPPPNRYPIQTEIQTFNEELIRDAITYEMSRGGQVFVVHNKVQNIKEIADMVQRLVPDARIGIGHGQMEGEELERVMLNFINDKYDVLVATTIIESGLDIPNANTMIINDAQNFALNVLHQLRGRVGRNNQKAFCYMMVPSKEILNDNARKRLKAIADFADIGSGFQIAMRDLDIRGAGDILGAEQSGFINEIGFEMYQKILNEAMIELKETELGEQMADNEALIHRECVIETDLGLQIPSDYVTNVSERMSLYKELDNIKTDEELDKYEKKLLDIFGPIPKETQELLKIIPLRLEAFRFHFEKIILKQGRFTGYFTGNMNSPFFQSELFMNILDFLQKYHPQVEMKAVNGKPQLVIKDVKSVGEAMKWLGKI
ncbi:MAG: transcription-repair coupling factor [Bacteroidetes bacterium]|nr:transcription-repair coupling factor [Bacteroidota bacterium]MCL1968490.1 transcription-repair coupling factor [Bacteroidota bacterium]